LSKTVLLKSVDGVGERKTSEEVDW